MPELKNRMTRGKYSLDLANDIKRETLQLIHNFASYTTENILRHIDRMDVRDTGALHNSIRSVVHAQANGSAALVSFYMKEYAPYVEQAVGKYWGVDADLKKSRGVSHENIHAPESGFPPQPLTATFDNLPYRTMGKRAKSHEYHDALRQRTHKPRQFMTREINYQINRVSWKLLETLGNTMEIHVLDTIVEALDPQKTGNVWRALGYNITTFDSNNPNMQTMDS